MSHPLYNPFASGNQSSTQGQYGLPSIQAERDPQRASHLGLGSSFSSSGASSAMSDNSGEIHPLLISQSVSHKPEQYRVIMDEDRQRSMDMHVIREEVRVLGKPMHQPMDQDYRFTSTQRDEFCSPSTGMASNPMSSTFASLGQRHSNVESGSSSLDWLSNYKSPTADDSKFYSSTVSSNYGSSGDNRLNVPSRRDHDIQSITGLVTHDCPVEDKPATSTESRQPKYTSDSAFKILNHFGLGKDDLDILLSYPEDQLTSDTLPFILRQIQLQKDKRDKTVEQPKPCPEPQTTRSVSGMESQKLSSSGGGMIHREGISSALLQPNKVVDYGHGKYIAGLGDDIGSTSGSRVNSGGSGSMSLMDTCDSNRHSQEPPQKNTTEVTSSALGSSHEQTKSVTSPSFSYTSILKSVCPPSHEKTKQLQTPLNQTYQTIPSLFSLPKKDTDVRVLKSEVPKSVLVKEPEANSQSVLKTQLSRHGFVLFDSNNTRHTKDQSKTPGQGSTAIELMKRQQIQQQMQKQPVQQTQNPPMQQIQNPPVQQMQNPPVQHMQQVQQMQKQSVSQTGQVICPPVFSGEKTVPPAPLIPNDTDASLAMHRPVLTPSDSPFNIISPAVPQPVPMLVGLDHMTLPTSNRPPPAKVAVSKGLPTSNLMQDYAKASPRTFPHTCSLCNEECTTPMDWINHLNSSLHIYKYIAQQDRSAGKDAKPSPSTSAQTSQHCHQKTSPGSRSRSRSSSPSHRPDSEGRREKCRSGSQSPHSSRYTRRSRSLSPSPWNGQPTSSRYRSHSRSPDRQASLRKRDVKRSSPRRNNDKRSSPRRRDEKWSSLRRNDCKRSPPRRDDERRSPPRKGDKRRSPPRKGDKRRSPPRKKDERRSPPRGKDETRSPPRKKDKRRSPPRKKDERQLSTEGLSLEQPKSVTAEELAKRQLGSPPAAQVQADHVKDLTSEPSESEAGFFTKAKSGKSSPPTMLKLHGIHNSLSRNDVVTAVKQFGKTKSVLMFRPKKECVHMQAVVCFEKEEDAKKLMSVKSFDVKGMPVTVAVSREKESVSQEQKDPPQNKPATSSVSTPETAKSTTTESVFSTPNMPPLEGPLTSVANKASTDKFTDQTTAVFRSKVLVSKAKNALNKQIAKTVKAGRLPAKGAVKKATVNRVLTSKAATTSTTQKSKTPVDKFAAAQVVAKEKEEETAAKTMSVPSRSTASESQPDVENSEPKRCQTKVQEANGGNSEDKLRHSQAPTSTVETWPTESRAKESMANSTVNESTKGKEISTEAKVFASKAETASTMQKLKTPVDNLVVAKENVEETAAKPVIVPSRSTDSEDRPDVENPRPKEFETKVQEVVVVLKDTIEVAETENVTVVEPKHQEKLDKADDTEVVEPMQLEDTEHEVSKHREGGNSAEGEGKKMSSTEAVSENSADKPSDSQPTSTVETDISVKALLHVQQNTFSETESNKQKHVSEKSETSTREPVVGLKETTEIDQLANRTVTELTKGKKVSTEAKVLDSKAKMASATQKPKTSADKLAGIGDVAKEKAEEAEAVSVPSKSTPSENQPGVEISKPKESESTVKEAVMVPAEVVGTANVTDFEPKHQEKLDKANNAGVVESMELGEMRAEVAEPMEVGSCAEGKGKEMTTTSAVPQHSADKSSDSQPPTITVETRPTDISVKGLLQQSTLSEPESSKQILVSEKSETSARESVVVLKEKTEVDQVASRTVTEPTKSKGFVTEAKGLPSKAETASATQKPETPTCKLVAAVTPQTIGEMVQDHLYPSRIDCLKWEPGCVPKLSQLRGRTLLLITKLPQYHSGYTHCTPHYREEDLAKRLKPFGFQHNDDTIYVVPQARMAFVEMPAVKNVHEIMKVYTNSGIQFKQTGLSFQVVADDIAMTPLGFYKSLMKLMDSPVEGDGARTVFITNISPIKERELREALKKISPVRNYLPLLNKVFIEFESVCDADQFEVWHGLLKPAPGYKVHRLTKPYPVAAVKTQMDESVRTEPAAAAESEQLQTASTSSSTAVTTPTAGEMVEKQQHPKRVDPVTAVKTQTAAASAKNAPVTTAAVNKQLPAASSPSSTAPPQLTPGEMMQKHLHQNRISCYNSRRYLSKIFSHSDKRQLLITRLPKYYDGCYTEEDIAKLLKPFGFQHVDDSIYVIPQTCMAFAVMPTVENVYKILNVTGKKNIYFKGSKLSVQVVSANIPMTPLQFYKSLMRLVKFPLQGREENTVLIKNISPSQARDLRQSLKNITNYVPLLNKVFIQFKSVHDADQFEVWSGLLKPAPGYKVHRLTKPYPVASVKTQMDASVTTEPAAAAESEQLQTAKKPGGPSPPSRSPANTLPERMNPVAKATVPQPKSDVPQDSVEQFWLTARSSPFVSPTTSPSFIIPEHQTVREWNNDKRSQLCLSMWRSIMLTGLPEENYKHEDVAKLVWRHIIKKNLHSLYYNVIVLPLQRRAFVHFAGSMTCSKFVEDHIRRPVSIKGCKLGVHIVVQHMNPECCEEKMYTTLMKLSNANVGDSESLKERLLCVEISETSVGVIKMVMEMVASTATFVSFLPLANRICIEMADSSGVTQVVEKYKTFSPDVSKQAIWSKVGRFETLQSLKQRLNDSRETVIIKFGPNTIKVGAKPPTVKCQTQPPPSKLLNNGSKPALQTSDTSRSTISELITAGPSTSVASNVRMEDSEEPGTEISVDSTGGEANEDVKKTKGEAGSLTPSVSTAELDTISVEAKPTVKGQTQLPPSERSGNESKPALQTSDPGGSTISEPITAGPSATTASDVTVEDSEKPATEISMDSSSSKAHEDVRKVKGEERSLTTSISTAEPDTISVEAERPTVQCQTQVPPSELLDNESKPALQTSDPVGSTISEPITAGPSATTASDVTMEDGEEPETEISMDSSGGEANEDVKEVKGEKGSVTLSFSTAEPDTISVEAERPTVQHQTQLPPPELLNNESKPALQTSDHGGSNNSEPSTAGPSAATASDVTMEEDGEEPGTEISMDSSGGEANEDVKKVRGEEGSLTTFVSITELDTINVEAKSPTVKCQTQLPPSEHSGNESKPALQTSDPDGSTISEPITAGPSATTASDVTMEEDGEEPGTEISTDSTLGSQANKDLEKGKEEEGSSTPLISTADVTSASAVRSGNTVPPAPQLCPLFLNSEENRAKLPQIDAKSFSIIQAAVRQYKLNKEAKNKAQDDFSFTVEEEVSEVSTDSSHFDEQNFNMDDFVTIDEIGDDVEETNPEPVSSSSSSSRPRRERQSSGVSSGGKHTSARSSKDYKSSASTSSSSSKSSKGSGSSNSGSVSPKKPKSSSESIKSPTKPSSSASVTKPSSSSFPLSTEPHSSPGQKTQQNKTTFQSKALNTRSSSCSTHSSSASHERKKSVSAATVKASMEPFQKEARTTEASVAMSDHKRSAEGIAAKTVVSKTKTESSSEIQPPLQGHGIELSQGQSQEIDFNVRTHKDPKRNMQECKNGDADKHTEGEGGGEMYQILDSFDHQTDERMNDGDQDNSFDTQQTEREEGQTLQDSEMDMDSSFQILDNVTEDQAATSQEVHHLVQGDRATLKKPSEECTIPLVNKSDDANVVGKDQETNKDTGNKQAPRDDEDGKKIKQKEEEVKGKVVAVHSSKDVENPDGQIRNEDQRLQRSQKPTAAETETDNQETRTKNGEATDRCGEPSKSNAFTKTASKSEEKAISPKKQDRTVKKYETCTKIDTSPGVSEEEETIKEAVKEMVQETKDSVEDKPAQDAASPERSGRRRSPRGKKDDKITLNLTEASGKRLKNEAATNRILGSVETISTRSRSQQEKTKKEDAPSRTRHTAARESHKRIKENTPKKEEKTSPKESTPIKKRGRSKTSVTLNEADDEEEEKSDEKTSRSAKRKHDEDTEESTNFEAGDEVEEEEEEREAVTTRTRGQAKKRTRQTPVRKSTRGKKVREEEEEEPADVLPPSSVDASSSLDKDPSTSSTDVQPEVQKTEVEAASRADVDAASAGQELQPENPENPENQTLEGGEEEKEGQSRTDIKAVSKLRRESVGPEAKRSRSQSPRVAADLKLSSSKPNNSLGQEFVVPKSGYFCYLCSVFYLNESTAKDVHCSSRQHYDNQNPFTSSSASFMRVRRR